MTVGNIGKLPSERDFLIKLAVDRFNLQFGKKINPKDCTIRSIPPNYRREKGYEVLTKRNDDFVRLQFYFNIMGIDNLRPYRIETDETLKTSALGDEVYVSLGTVNPYYTDNDIYRFRWMDENDGIDGGLRLMSGGFLKLISGEFLKEVL